jgi:hypothetical protein
MSSKLLPHFCEVARFLKLCGGETSHPYQADGWPLWVGVAVQLMAPPEQLLAYGIFTSTGKGRP